MPEQVSFIPYSVLVAAMATNHHFAGAVLLEKSEPPLEREWVRVTRLSRPVIENRDATFSFTAENDEKGVWEVTMHLYRRTDAHDLQWADHGPGGTAEYTPPPTPKPRTTKK